MSEDAVRLSMVGQVVRRRWRLLVVFAAAGAVAGAGASVLFSPGYETTANVLLQGPREPDELLTEARVATSSVVLEQTAAALHWGASGADLADEVTASAADGNIIEIAATEDTPRRARQLADQVAKDYVNFSTRLQANTADETGQASAEQQEVLRQQVSATNQRISDLHAALSRGEGGTVDTVATRTELESLRTALAEAMSKLEEIGTTAGQSKMVVMGPAERPAGPAAPTMVHFVAGGAGVFVLLGLFGHLIEARTDRRLRGEDQIASALGTTVLGGLDVPDEPATAERPPGLRRRLRRLVVADRPWYLPEPPTVDDLAAEHGAGIRYGRVLTRLREAGDPARVLAVVVAGDRSADRAARRLIRTAGAGRPAIAVATTSVERATVPDANGVDGALVVVTAGTRTAWELVGIAEACADAGHEVLGVVVSHPTRLVTAEASGVLVGVS